VLSCKPIGFAHDRQTNPDGTVSNGTPQVAGEPSAQNLADQPARRVALGVLSVPVLRANMIRPYVWRTLHNSLGMSSDAKIKLWTHLPHALG
jgi:hypothetical protein